jgi:hypothetical protein
MSDDLSASAVAGRPEGSPTRLEGTWQVERTGGLLPPLRNVEKRIHAGRGETRIAGFPGLPFDVEGLELRYRRPFSGFVDVLVPDGDGRFRGRATFRGREFGRFLLLRRD